MLARMRPTPNVGPIDRNVRMFLAVPAFIVVVESLMVFHTYTLALVAALLGAAAWTSGALSFCPVYRLFKRRMAAPAAGSRSS